MGQFFERGSIFLGTRPMETTKMVREYKQAHGLLTKEFRKSLQKWYNTGKGKSMLNEMVELLPLE